MPVLAGRLVEITLSPAVYEIESLNNDIKRILIEEEHFTEANFTFTIKPNISTQGTIIEISRQKPFISFSPKDSIRNLLGFNSSKIDEEYNLSPNPVNYLSFDIILIKCYIAQGMIFKGKISGINHNFTMNVDPGYKHIEKIRGGVQMVHDAKLRFCFKF